MLILLSHPPSCLGTAIVTDVNHRIQIFTWVPGTKLRISGWSGLCFYPGNNLPSSANTLTHTLGSKIRDANSSKTLYSAGGSTSKILCQELQFLRDTVSTGMVITRSKAGSHDASYQHCPRTRDNLVDSQAGKDKYLLNP